jgi:hypothetical protein
MVMGVLLLGACNGSKLFQSSDKSITTNIQAKLFSDPALKSRDIRVDSQNGIVTLTGSVDTDLERAAVERIASQEDGVRRVVNILSVTSETAAPPIAPPVRTTAEQPRPEKPRHARPAKPDNNQQVDASAELKAYTDSVAPDAAQPAPPPAPAPPAAVAPPDPAQVATAPAAAAPPAAPAPVPKPQPHVTISAGTVVTIRMADSIDSSRNHPGDDFAASVDAPIVVDGRELVSRGAEARVRLVQAKAAGTMTGQSELQLELQSLMINGVPYETQSGFYEQHGASRGTRTAETVGGGAVLGALIGGILGHGKGAAIGSVAGAGAGTAVQASTKGQQVKVPAETKIDFTLKDPVTVTITD